MFVSNLKFFIQIVFCIKNFANFSLIINKSNLKMENSEQNSEKPKVVKTRALPAKDLEIGAVATLASAKWKVSDWLTLLWITAAEFTTLAAHFNEILRSRNQSGGTKKGVVQSVKLLNVEINEAVVYVKGYILEKFKKDRATSMYDTFGIYHINKGHEMPRDYDGRKEALNVMIAGLKEHKLEDKEYGLEFWTDIKDRYDALADQTGALSSSISVSVGEKNQTKKEVQLALNSLIKAVQANYPLTWKEELRAWGFQKERY